MSGKSSTVAIIGAGPAGATMACLLAMRGIRTIVFDDDKRPELLVGESLIPSVIPVLRKLGIEDRVREFSVYKPGASFFHGGGSRLHFSFRDGGKKAPGYAYNVPRPRFDKLLRDRATELGVEFVESRANLGRSENPKRWHKSWQELIEYFYDGRMLRMYEAGSQLAEGKNPLNSAKLMERHMSRVIASMAAGVGTRSAYNRSLLKHSSKHLIWGVKDAGHYAVR